MRYVNKFGENDEDVCISLLFICWEIRNKMAELCGGAKLLSSCQSTEEEYQRGRSQVPGAQWSCLTEGMQVSEGALPSPEHLVNQVDNPDHHHFLSLTQVKSDNGLD